MRICELPKREFRGKNCPYIQDGDLRVTYYPVGGERYQVFYSRNGSPERRFGDELSPKYRVIPNSQIEKVVGRPIRRQVRFCGGSYHVTTLATTQARRSPIKETIFPAIEIKNSYNGYKKLSVSIVGFYVTTSQGLQFFPNKKRIILKLIHRVDCLMRFIEQLIERLVSQAINSFMDLIDNLLINFMELFDPKNRRRSPDSELQVKTAVRDRFTLINLIELVQQRVAAGHQPATTNN
ncbi:MAG: hypothetical protein DRH04_02055 [Deltaproteobacteria bacterium]|nr:MAG: hypothetical protein DRH04_02055 [Deltaproteobacteria bacterium]